MIQPPTDNLYKFVAIFGLILIGYSGYVCLQRLEEHSQEVVKWNARWEPLIVRAIQLTDDARDAAVCAIAAAEAKGSTTPTKADEHCAAVNAARADRQEASRVLAIEMEELRASKANLDHLRAQALFIGYLAIAGTVFGSGSIVVGFWFWYTRVQRPLDKEAAGRAK
jgi:hypothetical protein